VRPPTFPASLAVVTAPDQLSHAEQVYAIKTWRYLRLAMIVVVLGLGVAIGYEHSKTHPHCFQQSISAYYYTPVQAFFVGALVVIGACLICLKGNSQAEDLLLNLAGMFASVVAFVPTPGTGSCASVLGTTKDRNVNVANNVFALLAVGALGLAILIALVVRAAVRRVDFGPIAIAQYAVVAALWVTAAFVFGLARDFFVHNAHYTAAIAMFVCILAVAAINAFAPGTNRRARPMYFAIAGAMVLAAVVIGILGLTGWDYWVLGIEIALISLFAIFWATQTVELWHDGLR
jgi:hypothetical protein